MAISAAALAQEPFDCNGRIFRVLEEQGGSTFQEIQVDDSGNEVVFEDLHFFQGYAINGIAYRSQDNLIYGVLLEQPYRLCRIDASFQIERLAELPLPASMLFVSGDISPDGRYLVLLGFSPSEAGNLLALVDLESPHYSTSILPIAKSNPLADVHCADIAFHPTLNQLFGFEHSEGRLITIDLNTGLVDNTSYPVIEQIQGNVPSLFFDAFGRLYGVGAPEVLFTNRNVYRFDTETGNAALIHSGDFERNQDACSCPFKVELLNRVSHRNAYPCTSLAFEFTLLNRTDRVQNGLRLSDTFPEGTYIQTIDELPFQATVASGVGTRFLHLQNIQLPIGEKSFRITLAIPEGVAATVDFNQAYLDNVVISSLEATTRIASDDPETLAPDDPTVYSIKNLSVDFKQSNPVLCAGDTLWLDTDIPDALYNWSSGAVTASIPVTAAGWYAVTVSTGCEEAQGQIFVVQDELSVDLGPDITLELGESLEIIPWIRSSAPIQLYFWQSSDETTPLECYTCPDQVVSPAVSTAYQLTLENANGCLNTAQKLVKVQDFKLYAPNAFSPNQDEKNEVFLLYSRKDYLIRYWHIFDRWGNLLFQQEMIPTNDPAYGWDGTFKGQPMAPGLYIWQTELQVADGSRHLLSGELMLMR